MFHSLNIDKKRVNSVEYSKKRFHVNTTTVVIKFVT